MSLELSLQEKIAFCEGKSYWETWDVQNLPSLFMCDGPHGLRRQDNRGDHHGVHKSRPASCFPSAVLTACSWDVDLLGRIGDAIAQEALDQGVGVVLGPGVNLKRNPLCGRNFEYYSEDPYLAGKLGAGFITGVQKRGVGTSLKHFALNNQEFMRATSDSMIDERTMRELYLRAFEIAVQEGKPRTVMCAYNKINGLFCSDNRDLLTRILREEWGFEGLVMTDWGAMHDRIEAFKAGCDLNMPGGSHYMEEEVLEAVSTGELDERYIDRSVERIKKLVLGSQEALEKKAPCDYEAHHALTCQAAQESAVLLKNDDGILPLKTDQRIAIRGPMAMDMRYQGSGSSHIHPTRVIQPADVLVSTVEDIEQAEAVILFIGLPSEDEGEGYDRENMELPAEQNSLVWEMVKKNPNTVVVLFSGAPVETPWAEEVKAILYMGLPGQAGGEAVKNLLYGTVNPSGKLAETWPCRYSDCPSSTYFGLQDAHYREGIYVGYRYYDKSQVQVQWKFGFGLSYTSFEYTDAKIDGTTVTVRVRNTGSRPGAEVAQLYVASGQKGLHRPVKELKGFTKVFLNPDESTLIHFELDERSFALWQDGWKVPEGTYTILVGGNPDALLQAGCIEQEGTTVLAAPDWQRGSWYEKLSGIPSQKEWETMLGRRYEPYVPRKGNYTTDDTLVEMKKHSLAMKFMYWVVKKNIGLNATPGTGEYRMMLESSTAGPLRNLQINAPLPASLVSGLVAMANGKVLHGLMLMLFGKNSKL